MQITFSRSKYVSNVWPLSVKLLQRQRIAKRQVRLAEKKDKRRCRQGIWYEERMNKSKKRMSKKELTREHQKWIGPWLTETLA